MARRRSKSQSTTVVTPTLEDLVNQALDIARKARKHRCNLSGDNFYGNKLANLRAAATNAFQALSSDSPGDVSAMAEMIESVFSPSTDKKERVRLARDLTFSLQTTWKMSVKAQSPSPESLFPMSILSSANRGYLVAIGRQMNECFAAGCLDACAVMLRRLIEVCIIEAFEHRNIQSKIKDSAGDYLMLTDLVSKALSESSWSLSRNAKRFLPQLKDVGHQSAHGRYFLARPEDIERVRSGARVVIEEFLHHAGLLR